jgi:uncharacterized protein (UPF0332 family)
MKESRDIIALLEKAMASVKGAEALFKEKLYDFSVSRSYYAMFYATEALLLTKNLAYSSHKAIISAFGKEFIKTKTLPHHLHNNLRNAFRLRQAGDYGISVSISEKEANVLINQAKEFISAISQYLRNKEQLSEM